jgi:hypothetical protein
MAANQSERKREIGIEQTTAVGKMIKTSGAGHRGSVCEGALSAHKPLHNLNALIVKELHCTDVLVLARHNIIRCRIVDVQ